MRGRGWGRIAFGVAGLCAGSLLLAQAAGIAERIRKARDTADRGTAQGLQQALAEYARLIIEAQSATDRPDEAEATYLGGVAELRLGRFPEAANFYQRAVLLYRELGNLPRVATALNDLGFVTSRRGDQTAALAELNEALELQRDDPDPRERAVTLNNLGIVYNELGDPAPAREYLEQALDIRRKTGEHGPEGAALSNIGALFYLEGEMQKALGSYLEAIPLRKSAGDNRGAANTLSKVGMVYMVLNQPDQALQYFNDALKDLRDAGDVGEQADALSHLGGTYLELRQFAKAESFYGQALDLQKQSGKQKYYANDLSNLAMVYREQGDYEHALRLLREAHDIDEQIHEQRDSGITLQRMGAVLRLEGKTAEALDYLHTALPVARQLKERQLEAATLYEMGMAHAQARDWNQAMENAEAAIRLTENIRGGVASYEMRASYVASVRGQYELAIDALMQLGRTADALEMSERSRARSLLDLLTESRGGLRGGVDPALQRKTRALETSLRVLGDRLVRTAIPPEQQRALESRLQNVSTELDQVRSEIRQKNPGWAALTQPAPVTLREIQSLLDKDTTFVEFALGAPRSYMWLVTAESIEARALPERAVIDGAARKIHDAWSRNAPNPGRQLSDLLLKPIAGKLGTTRIVIAADGALEYVPFAALPLPEKTGRLLIDAHEVVNVPSASTLAMMRKDASSRTRPPNLLAVFADPVFSAQDLRVDPDAALKTVSTSERGWDDGGIGVPERLPGSRREAQQILSLAPGSSLQALDFNASREAALSPKLADYRIVHFATHGILNSRHPELSGLLLSMVDPSGKPANGFLQLNDIYNMKLRADLVVLSACETALGKEIAGEGLVGMTRGFMYAGSPRVVASLWRVPDNATSELMRQFYSAMLTKGLSPAAALHQAAIAVRREPRWSSPYYWAAFTLQGEWK